MTKDSKELDYDDDDFGELSYLKHFTKVPFEYVATDDLDLTPENEKDFHTNANTDEAESRIFNYI